MSETKRHPAILAGLMGAASWSVPTVAVAAPLDEVAAAISDSIVLQFAVGCAIGAVIAGTASVVYDRLSAPTPKAKKDKEPEVADEAELDDQRWSTSSLNLMRSAVDDDPTGDLGRMRTGRITIDEAAREEAEAKKEAKKAEAKNAEHKVARGRGRHGAHFATTRTKTAAPVARTGRHFAGAAPAAPEELRATPIKGRHFAAYVAANTADVEQLRAAEAVRRGKHAKGAVVAAKQEQTPLNPRERLALLPQIEIEAQVAEPVAVETVEALEPVAAEPLAPAAGETPAPAKAEAPAERTQHKPTLRERMAKRTRNVREVLADRLRPDAMETIPVITRADGSTSDIRPSWFDQTLVPVLASITGITAKLDDTATRTIDEAPAVPAEVAVEARDSRADYISQRVAEVNVGMFPERRSVEDLEQEDMWEQALKAMGETIRQESPIFQDVVGGPATIDDPDGLEGPTGFIPFRVPAGRPEVVDTETYIDYLLRDEFSHNESQVIKRSSHAYLRVIEGGTNPVRARRRASETGSAQKTGRHFSSVRYVAEA